MEKYGLSTEKYYFNKLGYRFKIVKFIKHIRIKIEFDSGYVNFASASQIKKGSVKDRLSPSVYGVGILDVDKESNDCLYYKKWIHILMRCYDPKTHKRQPYYKGCTISDEWKYFSNFRNWMCKQDWKNKHLDKDIIVLGNKIYGAEYCCFVDSNINSLMTGSTSGNSSEPIGVYKNKNGRYVSYCNGGSKDKNWLGTFDTVEKARSAYCEFKSKLARKLAEDQDKIVKDGLIRYAVELEKEII